MADKPKRNKGPYAIVWGSSQTLAVPMYIEVVDEDGVQTLTDYDIPDDARVWVRMCPFVVPEPESKENPFLSGCGCVGGVVGVEIGDPFPPIPAYWQQPPVHVVKRKPPKGKRLPPHRQWVWDSAKSEVTWEDNTAYFTDNGTLPVGRYSIEVRVQESDGTIRVARYVDSVKVVMFSEEAGVAGTVLNGTGYLDGMAFLSSKIYLEGEANKIDSVSVSVTEDGETSVTALDIDDGKNVTIDFDSLVSKVLSEELSSDTSVLLAYLLANYYTQSEVDAKIAGESGGEANVIESVTYNGTKCAVSGKSALITSSMIESAIKSYMSENAYLTVSDLKSYLEENDYMTQDDMSQYVTSASLSNTLASYVTTSVLSSYATKADVTSAISASVAEGGVVYNYLDENYVSNKSDTYTSASKATDAITLTEDEYSALASADSNTLYFTVDK